MKNRAHSFIKLKKLCSAGLLGTLAFTFLNACLNSPQVSEKEDSSFPREYEANYNEPLRNAEIAADMEILSQNLNWNANEILGAFEEIVPQIMMDKPVLAKTTSSSRCFDIRSVRNQINVAMDRLPGRNSLHDLTWNDSKGQAMKLCNDYSERLAVSKLNGSVISVKASTNQSNASGFVDLTTMIGLNKRGSMTQGKIQFSGQAGLKARSDFDFHIIYDGSFAAKVDTERLTGEADFRLKTKYAFMKGRYQCEVEAKAKAKNLQEMLKMKFFAEEECTLTHKRKAIAKLKINERGIKLVTKYKF